MFSKKKRVVEEARRILARYPRLDPHTAALALRRRILEWMARRGPDKLLEDYGDIADAASLYPHNSEASVVLVIAEHILDTGLHEGVPGKKYSIAIRRIAEILERADSEYLERSTRALTLELFPDADIFASTGGEILHTSIMGARSKIEVVRAPFLSPYGKGKRLVEDLDAEGIPSLWVPDHLRPVAVERSDFVFIPVYAVTREGLIVTDYGVAPAVETAARMGKAVMALHSWTGLLALFEAGSLESLPRVEGIRLYDTVDPDEYNIKLVTDKFIIDTSREKLLNLAGEEVKGVKEIVRAAIRSVTG